MYLSKEEKREDRQRHFSRPKARQYIELLCRCPPSPFHRIFARIVFWSSEKWADFGCATARGAPHN